MALRSKLERDALFKKMRAKAENKVRVRTGCPPWPYGILYLVLFAEKALTCCSMASLPNLPMYCLVAKSTSFSCA